MNSFNKNKFKFSLLEPLSLVGETIVLERGKQSVLICEELKLYNALIKDLVNECPSIDIRNQILNISYYIIEDLECYDKLIEDKKLPINKIIKRIPIIKSFLELWQDYIIAYVIIIGNPNYKYVQEYLRIDKNLEVSDEKVLDEDIARSDELESLIKGIVISKSKRKAIIITSKGEFKKININDYVEIGEEVSGIESKGWKKYKVYIAIGIISIATIVSILSFMYITIENTVVINTTSLIKIEVNSFGRIVNAQSPTDKGEEMLGKINIQDRELDESIYEVLKYASENEMIPGEDILITVSGKKIDFETLEQTKKFLENNDIPVKLNNSGNEHYINQ